MISERKNQYGCALVGEQSQLRRGARRCHHEGAPRWWKKVGVPFSKLDLALKIKPLAIARKHLVPEFAVVGSMVRTRSPPPFGDG
jgi:hypothetical protein